MDQVRMSGPCFHSGSQSQRIIRSQNSVHCAVRPHLPRLDLNRSKAPATVSSLQLRQGEPPCREKRRRTQHSTWCAPTKYTKNSILTVTGCTFTFTLSTCRPRACTNLGVCCCQQHPILPSVGLVYSEVRFIRHCGAPVRIIQNVFSTDPSLSRCTSRRSEPSDGRKEATSMEPASANTHEHINHLAQERICVIQRDWAPDRFFLGQVRLHFQQKVGGKKHVCASPRRTSIFFVRIFGILTCVVTCFFSSWSTLHNFLALLDFASSNAPAECMANVLETACDNIPSEKQARRCPSTCRKRC